MSDASQNRVSKKHRRRPKPRGIVRFEVRGLDIDRELIRLLARRLAEDGPDAVHLRAAVNRSIAGELPRKGGVLAALRRSPLVGAGLELTRPRERGP